MKTTLPDQISKYAAKFPQESEKLDILKIFIAHQADVTDRKSMPVHITASGIIMNGNAMLMVKHPWLNKWLQPGGHMENGESPLETAIREVREETGVLAQAHRWHGSHDHPVDIDVHVIPENEAKNEAAHYHYDFRYLLTLDAMRNEMELHCGWIQIGEINETSLANLVSKLDSLIDC